MKQEKKPFSLPGMLRGGVASVNADQLLSPEIVAATNVRDLPEPVFYSIKKGDTLWAIATDFYKDGAKYPKIVKYNAPHFSDQ